MKTSEEYSSYWMKIIMLTGAMFVFSITGGLLAGAIRMIYLVKLNKSLIRAATNLHSAGQIMKKAILEPSVLAVIANEGNGMDFNEKGKSKDKKVKTSKNSKK
ncbi:Protein CBG27455 [Caenorhabditis briggsae]|uniref:Protein CBG27455 n=1 Tax=Caenorhabditis briggsae TaxID=6238 RepID=B6IK32_CAEBR|nr:Protein CBG27455 [Caenorhabditis briggsae]CAS00262.1 Protein CBG27455 [Caenorhabditis briggsae]